ncbi:DsbA family protein [Terriglobus sp. RCC_193]|uniref:DsbA family protein n=1 Tax=Terriglobus sp. RCC_193 TaxID=3239218 RepID=UPI0035259380
MSMFPRLTRLSALLLLAASTILSSGCRAQAGAEAMKMSPELTRRVALLIRTKAQLPFNYEVKVNDRRPSPVSGYDQITVSIGEYGKALKPMAFLISKDNQSLAQMNSFDLSKDPLTLTSDAGRPSRGGNEKAPVKIVVYDDLECPFCARMHAQMFPALTNRYGDKVRIVYKDFPLTQIHPWGMHAAVNADCLADQSAPAYWNFVDYMHSHLDTVGIDPDAKDKEKTLPVALKQLDRAALDEGTKQKLDMKRLNACVDKQDETAVKAYMKEGEGLSVGGVPALFINGEMITGAVPIEYVYRAVDDALLAQGVTSPPAVPLPSLDAPEASTPAPAAK